MSNSTKNKKNKKGKKNKAKKTSVNPKKILIPVIIILVCFALGLGIGFGIKAAIKHSRSKVLDVAFYQLPENLKNELEKRITAGYEGKINIEDISDQPFDARKIANKYELVFSRNGLATAKLDKFAEELPMDWYANMPSSLRRKAGKELPIILDHYEMSYYRDGRNEAGLNFPQDIAELQDYLKKMRAYTFSPFFGAGSNDDTLLALISAFVEAYGGTESYNLLVENYIKKPSLQQMIDFPLAGKKSKEEFSLRTILDMIRNWQSSGVTHPNWFSANQGDVEAFVEDNQVAILFTSLSTHRTMKYKLVSKLDADRMPVVSFDDKHGLIAPYYVGMKFTDSTVYDKIFTDLIDDKSQKELSFATKLGPVSARCQAYDRQADDVRFLAASCFDGPLPPLGDSVFQINKDAKHQAAEEIRNYLRTGSVFTVKKD